MRHRKTGVKLGRTSSHRDAMFRNMVTSLLKHDRIHTTDVKAKELRRWVDKIITLAKRGDLHARRQALSIVREKEVVHKLFEEAPKRFGSIKGGYSRIVKIGYRPGDAAPMSLIELISADEKTAKTKKKKAKAPKKERPAAKKAKSDSKAPETAPAVEAPEAESQEVVPADDVQAEEAVAETPAAEPEKAPEAETAEADAAPAAESEAPEAEAAEAEEAPAAEQDEDSEKK